MLNRFAKTTTGFRWWVFRRMPYGMRKWTLNHLKIWHFEGIPLYHSENLVSDDRG